MKIYLNIILLIQISKLKINKFNFKIHILKLKFYDSHFQNISSTNILKSLKKEDNDKYFFLDNHLNR